jgi:hypothetical protein
MFAKKTKKSDFKLAFFAYNRYTTIIEAHGVGNNPLQLKTFSKNVSCFSRFL